jgi:hypothetical protein
MKVWLACFLVLFALAELFNWLRAFSLPLPIYILGGAFLAVASNYNQIFGSYFSQETKNISPAPPQLEIAEQSTSSIAFTNISPVNEVN